MSTPVTEERYNPFTGRRIVDGVEIDADCGVDGARASSLLRAVRAPHDRSGQP